MGNDFTFNGMKTSASFLLGWDHFRLKLGLAYYKPEARNNGLVFPVIGMWWRFTG